MAETRQRLHEMLLIGVFCGFFFFYGLSAVGLLGADEPRYAQVAREMLARNDWVTPTLWGKPWLEKPPLLYWGEMISYWLLGVRDWVARVPSAALATLMVFGLYLFLRRFFRGAELGGAFIAASTVAILGFARGGETDMSLAACFTLAMLAWLAWHVTGEKKFLAGFYFFLAVATLAKGPVAPLLAGLIIAIFAAVQRELRIVARTLWWPGLLLFASLLPGMRWCRRAIRNSLTSFSCNTMSHALPPTCTGIRIPSGTTCRFCCWDYFPGRCLLWLAG